MSRGLPNLGNTCYFNTAVQFLCHVPLLVNTLLTKGYTGDCELTREFCELARQVWSVGDEPDPRPLHRAFTTRFSHFAGQGQHDAQEVILCLVDIFENSLGKDFIKKIFTGREVQETVWPGGSSTRPDDFTSVTFQMSTPGEFTLEELLKQKETWDALGGYMDDKGQTHNVAAVRRRIEHWPIVAMFTFGMWGPKSIVSLPEIFEGRHLFAVVLHMGVMQGGHYAIAVRHKNKWFQKDDDAVTEMKGPPLKGPFYMAMYRLQTLETVCPPGYSQESENTSVGYSRRSCQSVSSLRTSQYDRIRTPQSFHQGTTAAGQGVTRPLCIPSPGPEQKARSRSVPKNR